MKINILDDLVRDTAEFLSFFNQTTKVLQDCDLDCLAQCANLTTKDALMIETKVACLDRCGCYHPKTAQALSVKVPEQR